MYYSETQNYRNTQAHDPEMEALDEIATELMNGREHKVADADPVLLEKAKALVASFEVYAAR